MIILRGQVHNSLLNKSNMQVLSASYLEVWLKFDEALGNKMLFYLFKNYKMKIGHTFNRLWQYTFLRKIGTFSLLFINTYFSSHSRILHPLLFLTLLRAILVFPANYVLANYIPAIYVSAITYMEISVNFLNIFINFKVLMRNQMAISLMKKYYFW